VILRALVRPGWLAAALAPTAALGSFGGKPCGPDFGCHFEAWGLWLGAIGIPNSAFLFVLLHLGFRHTARSKAKQLILGGFAGVVAYEVAAAGAALMGSWDKEPLLGFVPAYLALAWASVFYARSQPSAGSGRPAAG
jgi:hypothetical protein